MKTCFASILSLPLKALLWPFSIHLVSSNSQLSKKMLYNFIENPTLPLSTPVYDGIQKKKPSLKFSEKFFAGQQGGFSLEFVSHKGVPMNMSVRMGLYNSGPSTIVFNHLKRGSWHKETHHANVFSLGTPFHMRIVNCRRHYSVHVNGAKICDFHQHENPKHVNSFKIRGDLKVSRINFENFKHGNGKGTQVGLVATPTVVQPRTVIITQPKPTLYPSLQPQVVIPSAPIYVPENEVIIINGQPHYRVQY
ncbi:unnamed protein product [Caenorhabditis auriculariae]|uniref:Galectin n=1 Tax=Caenorhabditis auriculariae TaxID=2777116 RepID=A0A8S1HGU4_9PELO|nr:unnamed protein product [Caenorhabditis auriculariae]